MHEPTFRRAMIAATLACAFAASAAAKEVATFAVNEYFGVRYDREPVSFDVAFVPPAPAAEIGLRPGPCQVEIVKGTPAAVMEARLWTMVDFRPNTCRLAEADVLDWPNLIAKINAELGSGQPTVGKLAWSSLRRAFRTSASC